MGYTALYDKGFVRTNNFLFFSQQYLGFSFHHYKQMIVGMCMRPYRTAASRL